MGLEVHKNDNLEKMFNQLAKMDPKDPNRDRFLKRKSKTQKQTKK